MRLKSSSPGIYKPRLAETSKCTQDYTGSILSFIMVPRVYHPGATSPCPSLPDGMQDLNLRVVDGASSEIDAFEIEFNLAVIKNKDFKTS